MTAGDGQGAPLLRPSDAPPARDPRRPSSAPRTGAHALVPAPEPAAPVAPPARERRSTGGSHLRGRETQSLAARVEDVRAALTVGGERIDPAVRRQVDASLDRVSERLALGVDHTIVALLGGTGSGKSSLFNAVSGLEFADVGVRRPTTSEVSACVWGEGAEALLDWLGVGEDRRIERESLLDGETEAPLRGLVLLDLPDHDSIAPAHRDVVDRLMPMADLLVWVVDPQKYADDALHSGYLRGLVGHEASMVVVLNQIDTVPPDVRGELVTDLERLLAEDGLVGVEVRTVSARTGDGVPEVRDRLAEVVARRSVAAERAGAEVNDAAVRLAGQVADDEPGPAALDVTAVVDVLADAAGLEAVVDGVATVVRGRAVAVPAFGAVQQDTVALARDRWLGATTRHLPLRWQEAVVARVASTDRLRLDVERGLDEVRVTARRPRVTIGLFALAVVLLVGTIAAASVALGARIGSSTTGWAGGGRAWVSAVVLLVLTVAAAVGARLVQADAARRRAGVVRREGRAALEAVAERGLAEPTRQVLAEHREVRDRATAARSF